MSETRANGRPWPVPKQHRPKRGPSWIERSFERFRQENVVKPQLEARRWEERYGRAEPYPDVSAFDRGRMAAAEEDNSPDGLAHFCARAERTPPCVKSGACTLARHEDTCPLSDD